MCALRSAIRSRGSAWLTSPDASSMPWRHRRATAGGRITARPGLRTAIGSPSYGPRPLAPRLGRHRSMSRTGTGQDDASYSTLAESSSPAKGWMSRRGLRTVCESPMARGRSGWCARTEPGAAGWAAIPHATLTGRRTERRSCTSWTTTHANRGAGMPLRRVTGRSFESTQTAAEGHCSRVARLATWRGRATARRSRTRRTARYDTALIGCVRRT